MQYLPVVTQRAWSCHAESRVSPGATGDTGITKSNYYKRNMPSTQLPLMPSLMPRSSNWPSSGISISSLSSAACAAGKTNS